MVVNTDVTEHRLFKASSCPLGGQDGSGRVSGEFPERVSGPVQYGASVRSLASTLYAYGCVSYDRCSKIMRGLMGVSISPGTVASMVAGLAEDVEPSLDSIRHGLTNGSSCHFDETVVDLGGGRAYVINASSSLLTYQTVSLTRSIEGLRSNGVVQDFRGTAIHDCYSGYWGLFESHAVCCVHIIRELKGIMDLEPEHSWPRLFLIFLRDMKKARDNALEGGQNALPAGVLEEFDQRYDRIMNLAGRECPETIQVSARKSCKNVGKERALVSRLARRKAAVCMFAHDFSVDFDNNQAERDQRYVKTKNKVSGTFRTEKGARDYVAVMSYVSTSLKHGMSASEAIERAIRKDPPIFT